MPSGGPATKGVSPQSRAAASAEAAQGPSEQLAAATHLALRPVHHGPDARGPRAHGGLEGLLVAQRAGAEFVVVEVVNKRE